MSRKDFAARYGAAQADLDLVVEFARNHGLAVVDTSIARHVVIVSGTVEQMGRAFAVELGRYESPTETYSVHGYEDVVREVTAHGPPPTRTRLRAVRVYRVRDTAAKIADAKAISICRSVSPTSSKAYSASTTGRWLEHSSCARRPGRRMSFR
jgi:hypothetical protein